MGRRAVFVGAWVVLFGGTLMLMRALGGTTDPGEPSQQRLEVLVSGFVRDATKAQLEGLGRRTKNPNGIQGIDDNAYPGLGDEFSKAIKARKKPLLDCVARSRMTARTTEYLEISFDFRRVSAPSSATSLADVIVERSTLILHVDEIDCLQQELSKLRFASALLPHDRTFYVLCINSSDNTESSVTTKLTERMALPMSKEDQR